MFLAIFNVLAVLGVFLGFCFAIAIPITAAEMLLQWLGWYRRTPSQALPAASHDAGSYVSPAQRQQHRVNEEYAHRPTPLATYFPGDAEAKEACYLTDECVSPAGVTELRRFGLNVRTVKEVGLAGAEDPVVLAYAFKHKRMLVTHDKGFRYWCREFYHCGVLLFRQGRQFNQEMIRVCLKPARAHTE